MIGFFDSIFDVDGNGEIDPFEFGMMIHELEREDEEISGRSRPKDDFIFDDDDDDDDMDDMDNMDNMDDMDEDELAEAHDAAQPESLSERRARVHSLAADISCLITELETLHSRIQDAKTDLETLLEIEQDILLDLPDWLSCSDYESEMENAVDAIEDALSCLNTADSGMSSSIIELESASIALDILD